MDAPQQPDLLGDSLFRGIFESDVAGFVVGDLGSGRILAVNERLIRITGHPREAFLGAPDAWRTMTPAEYHHLDEKAAREVLEKGSATAFEKEYRRLDGTRVPVRVSCAAVRDRPGLLIVQVDDISEQVAARRALAEREQELATALEAGKLAVVDYDHRTGQFSDSPRFNELYGYPPDQRLTIEDIRRRYHEDDLARIRSEIRRDDADPDRTGFDWTIHLRMPDGSERWVQGLGEYVRDADGRIARSRGVVLDVTERKKWERHQQLLVGELNHRVKNTLAIVQGLAHQSFRGEVAEEARAAFEQRLIALSKAHDLLTRHNWESADLSDLVAQCGALSPGRMHSDGPALRLLPKAAISVALALHELASNAVKYGALSNEGGSVSIAWSVVDGARLELEWRESGGPPVREPASRGFGTRMIERGLASELGGTVAIAFDPRGVRCAVSAALAGLKA